MALCNSEAPRGRIAPQFHLFAQDHIAHAYNRVAATLPQLRRDPNFNRALTVALEGDNAVLLWPKSQSLGVEMVAYLQRKTDEPARRPHERQRLSHELFHGLTPEQFDMEAKSLAAAEAMTPAVRARIRARLTERLMTPPDTPSWGPDWINHGDKYAPKHGKGERKGLFAFFGGKREEDEDEDEAPLSKLDEDTQHVISRNLEKSRQIHHYRGLYVAAAVLAIAVMVLAMFVDYQIIRGDIWTRALSNEFMVVPASLQSTVTFKSLQVIFAVLIVHFMLKITGAYGRNALITTAFAFALVMIGCLGYLVAYNNMPGGTSAQHEAAQMDASAPQTQNNSIDQLFNSMDNGSAKPTEASMTSSPKPVEASTVGLPIPKISQTSLANADSWFWLAFASVIFFIVTTVAALYMQTTENNIRNAVISNDYRHRQRQFAQLHLLDLADRNERA